MGNGLKPDWVEERQARKELEKAKAEASAQRQIAASLTIEKYGPIFWNQLLKELKIAGDALRESDGNINVNVSVTGDIAGECTCNIQVGIKRPFPNLAYLNLFYSKRCTGVVRCVPSDGGEDRLEIHAKDDGSGVFAMSHFGNPMDEARTAQFLIEPIVDALENNS